MFDTFNSSTLCFEVHLHAFWGLPHATCAQCAAAALAVMQMQAAMPSPTSEQKILIAEIQYHRVL
jgi:hypothetical protein